MALNIGDNFKQRWLAIPEAIRHSYCDELRHICALLEPESQVQKWQYQDAVIQQRQRHVTEQAYAELKQQILAEQARLKAQQKRERQAALEQALADKRAQEQADLLKLEQQEAAQQQQQDEYLKRFGEHLIQQSHCLSTAPLRTQADSNPRAIAETATKPLPSQCAVASASASQALSGTEQDSELRLRLELEAEALINQTLEELRLKLRSAAIEEIALQIAKNNKA